MRIPRVPRTKATQRAREQASGLAFGFLVEMIEDGLASLRDRARGRRIVKSNAAVDAKKAAKKAKKAAKRAIGPAGDCDGE